LTDVIIIDRTWNDPAWGTKVHVIRPCQESWPAPGWSDHIAVRGLFCGACIFMFFAFIASLDHITGKQPFRLWMQAILNRQFAALILGSGFALALLQRWENHKERVAMGLYAMQAEIYTNGLYLAKYGFVDGMHPFFYWSDIRHVDVAFNEISRYATVLLKLRELEKIGTLELNATAIANILAIPQIGNADTPLAQALRQAAAKF
jgi:hypothetical protein